jgi:hypothetical protein
MNELNTIRHPDFKETAQGTDLFAQYGKAIYVAQVLEQQAINMLAIDDIIKSKPESADGYEAIWAKYDHSKKMVGVMATLLQDAYHMNEDDIFELKEVLGWRNNLANRYFRFNDILFSSPGGRQKMVKDFVDFANSVKAISEKLDTYAAIYYVTQSVTKDSIDQMINARKEEWKDAVIDDSYDSSIRSNDY